jgi:sec-independent protein translocase protein TatB
MLDISWSEILVVGVVALIFVGPKDMPVLLRTIGRYTALVKRQIGDFRAELNLVLKEADLDLARQEIAKVEIKSKEAPGESSKAFDDAVRAASKALKPQIGPS